MATSCCGYCYKQTTAALQRCGKCKKRCYCSKDCQVADRKCGHKHWCGVAGELGLDFEIRDTGVPGKGLGMFALRDFERNDKILAERYAMIKREVEYGVRRPPDDCAHVLSAIMALEPNAESILHKFHHNCIAVDGDLSAVFIHTSRVNHDCVGNAYHRFVDQHKLQILLAAKPIKAGEEITFAYAGCGSPKGLLLGKWGIRCACEACTNPEIRRLLEEAHMLDKQVNQLGSEGHEELAILKAHRLIEVNTTLSLRNVRTYYDLFVLNVRRQRTMDEAMKYIKLAFEAERDTFSGCKDQSCGSMQKFRKYQEDPSQHPLYKVLDRR